MSRRHALPAAPTAARLKSLQRRALRLLWSLVGLRPELTVDGRAIGLGRAALEVSRHQAIETLTPTVSVRDAQRRYEFRCATHAEFVRVYTMLAREEGTIRWLRDEVRGDDVIYDVGANIGAFAVFAAVRLRDGVVYAFEPHVGNAARLLANLAANGVEDRVKALSCALGAAPGVFDFHYGDLVPATTAFSQVAGRARAAADGAAGAPELKLVVTIDHLLGEGVLRPADLVKVDVDGQELGVLEGMRGLLTGGDRPRAVQVEVNPHERASLDDFMRDCGYGLVDRHHSAGGLARLAAGEDAEAVAFNGIFRPAAA